MAKQLLTKQIAAEMKSLLKSEGAKVTAKAICDRAGVGSYTTASRFLDELRAEEAALLSMPEDVADEYRSFQDFIWTAAMREATCGFEAERNLLERDRNKAEALARERLDVIREMELDAAAEAKRMAQMQERLHAAKKRIADLERRVLEERTRAETLQAFLASVTPNLGSSSALSKAGSD